MPQGVNPRIEALAVLSLEERLSAVERMGDSLWEAIREGAADPALLPALRAALVEVIEADIGTGLERLPVGVLLGRVGDPRLRAHDDAAYWAELTLRSGDVFQIGRFPVTNFEYRRFVEAGGYTQQGLWSEEGWAWLQACDNPWPVLAQTAETDRYLVGNQPVVGVTHYEAEAFARWAGARLPRWYERVWAVRGAENRPYPWGSPFGEGNANTKEEVLHRPCAVGMYVHDRTPEGVYDLAGNAGEWTAEQVGEELLLAPGSWDQPSLASWAKASTTEQPDARWPALGFRLFRDVG